MSATTGKRGSLLLDPTDMYITADGSTPETGAYGISTATLQNLLSGEDVTIFTQADPNTQGGNITITAPLAYGNSGIPHPDDIAYGTLTLDSYHSIVVDAPVTVGGYGALNLITNDGGTGGALTFANGGNISFNAPTKGALSINGNAYTLVDKLSTLNQDIAATPSGYYALAQSIDASGTTYDRSPINSVFTGTFEGLGNTINNLTINVNGIIYSGLFKEIGAGGIVQDLGLTNVTISSLYTYDTQVTALNGGSAVGALVGFNNGGTLLRDYSTGTMNIGQDYGDGNGIVGSTTAAGGLVGFNRGLIDQSYSSVNINGGGTAGGLVGVNVATISNSYATGSIWGWNAGGLVGYNLTGLELGSSKNYVGQISNSYATGDVHGFGPDGGFVAYNTGIITNSYATGSVDYTDDERIMFGGGIPDFELGAGPGGFVGENSQNGRVTNGGTISNSSASGLVYTDCCNAGTFASYNLAYLNNDSSTQSGPLTGLQFNGGVTTSGDPSQIATPTAGVLPVGFSSAIWNIQSGQTNPLLSWQVAPASSSGTNIFQKLLQDSENSFTAVATSLADDLNTLGEDLLAFGPTGNEVGEGLAYVGTGLRGLGGVTKASDIVLQEAGSGVVLGDTVLTPMQRGLVFQDQALAAKGVAANTQRLVVQLPSGEVATVIPDALGNTIVEVKDVANLYASTQFRAYLATGKPIELIVSPTTQTISAPLTNLIRQSGGTIQIYDPSTGVFTNWPGF